MTGGSERIDEQAYLATIASQTPSDMAQAVAAYVKDRKKKIVRGLEKIKGFELDEVRAKVKALVEIAHIFDANEEVEPADIERQQRMVGKKVVKESPATYLAHLYDVLTPPGWREEVEPKIQAYIEICEEKVLLDDDAVNARAGIEEARHFMRFLSNTEKDGSEAQAMLHLARRQHGR